jgi:DNA topoisomerase-1
MIVAKNGRYGPYVSHNGVNATLPRDKTPETITLEEAAALIDARAEHAPAPHARPRKAAKRAAPGGARAPKKPSAKGAPPKRPAAKASRKTKQAAE